MPSRRSAPQRRCWRASTSHGPPSDWQPSPIGQWRGRGPGVSDAATEDIDLVMEDSRSGEFAANAHGGTTVELVVEAAVEEPNVGGWDDGDSHGGDNVNDLNGSLLENVARDIASSLSQRLWKPKRGVKREGKSKSQ